MSKRNAKQIELVLATALAKGATVAQAALQAGVSERTAYRYMKKPGFEANIESIQNETLQQTADILSSASAAGVYSLVALLDPSMPPSVRRAAARDAIDMGVRLREAVDLEKRLAALENQTRSPSPTPLETVPSPPQRRSKRRRRGDAALQLALACGNTVVQAAAKAGVSERTVYRRLNDPGFRERIEALRTDMVKRAAALLIAAMSFAAKTLVALLSTTTPAAVRRQATRDIIELSQKLREITILEKRLAALEQNLNS
jgi:phage terminase small subunit